MLLLLCFASLLSEPLFLANLRKRLRIEFVSKAAFLFLMVSSWHSQSTLTQLCEETAMVALVCICSMTGSICLMINERISAVRAVNLAPLMSTKINLCYQELLIFFSPAFDLLDS